MTNSAAAPPCPSCGQPLGMGAELTADGQTFRSAPHEAMGLASGISGRCGNEGCSDYGRDFGLVEGRLVPLDDLPGSMGGDSGGG